MAGHDDDDDDDFFKKVYGEGYKPPARAERMGEEEERREREREARKRERERDRERDRLSDEDRDPRDVPRDFRNKYSRAWDARARAVERHYNKRRDDELTCRTCGEKGHPTQGCPSTLSRRTPSVPPFTMTLDDRRFRARLIGTGGETIKGLERDSGCRIKMDDNTTPGAPEGSFVVRVMGSDKEAVEKGEKLIKEMVAKLEEEFKNRPLPQRRTGPGPGGPGGYGQGAAAAPGLAPIPGQPQYVIMQPDGTPAVVYYGGVPPGAGPSGASSGYGEEEGMADMDVGYEEQKAREAASLAAAGAGPGGRGSVSPAPQVVAGRAEGGTSDFVPSAGSVDTSKIPGSLDELERMNLLEKADLTSAQRADEEKERRRHEERMAEIHSVYDKKLKDMEERQMQRRSAFFQLQRLFSSSASESVPTPAPAPAPQARTDPRKPEPVAVVAMPQLAPLPMQAQPVTYVTSAEAPYYVTQYTHDQQWAPAMGHDASLTSWSYVPHDASGGVLEATEYNANISLPPSYITYQ